MNVSPLRHYPFWIDEWVESTGGTNSPKIYRKWAALAAISAAIQRKVFVTVQGRKLYPNLYVALVGPPGIGKTLSIEPVRTLLAQLQHISLSPAKLSPEKFIQLVSRSSRMLPLPENPFFTQAAYAIFISEIASFIRKDDRDIIAVLTDLYDSQTTWTYATLSRDEDRIENVCLTMLGGITPKTFAQNFGAASIGAGFTARVNFIYSAEYKAPEIFSSIARFDYEPFLQDLKKIHNLSGECFFDRASALALQAWVTAGMPPAPTDAKLAEYLPRRWLHLVKLCVIYALAESSNLLIELRHFEAAKETLLEAEAVAGPAFEFMSGNPMMEAIRNAHIWALAIYAQKPVPIPEMQLKRKLLQDIQPQHLSFALGEMVNSGYFKALTEGSRSYVPQNIET